MKHLIIGGTGTVGSHVVRTLVARGEQVRVMTSSAEKAGRLPRGVEGVVANLEKKETLAAACAGVDGVFLLVALAQNETAQGLAAVEAARQAKVRRIVYMSVAQADRAMHVPHFATKIPIEKAVMSSGIPFTILRPNNFHQNDTWFKDVIPKYGIYPQPLGDAGVSRVDVRDIADAAANALTTSNFQGKIFEINGPDMLTGNDCARIYAKHLGREVRYGGNDLDAWEKQALTMMPAWLVHDLRIMYKHFQDKGLKATAGELAGQAKIIGHPPKSFDAFVAEIAPSWK